METLNEDDFLFCGEVMDDIEKDNRAFSSMLFRRVAMNPCLYLLENSQQVYATKNNHYCFRMDAPSSLRLQMFKDCLNYMHKDVVKVVLTADRSEAFIKTTLSPNDVHLEVEIAYLMGDCPKCDNFYSECFDCDVCGPSFHEGSVIIDQEGTVKPLQF